jgi:hypothetical protein
MAIVAILILCNVPSHIFHRFDPLPRPGNAIAVEMAGLHDEKNQRIFFPAPAPALT